MKKIQFTTRTLTIILADTRLKCDSEESFPELCLFFDDEEFNNNYSFIEPGSDIGTINSLFKILECEGTEEMKGHKIRVLLYKTTNDADEWIIGWEFAGYGALMSDRFIDAYEDGTIMPQAELEKTVAERIC